MGGSPCFYSDIRQPYRETHVRWVRAVIGQNPAHSGIQLVLLQQACTCVCRQGKQQSRIVKRWWMETMRWAER